MGCPTCGLPKGCGRSIFPGSPPSNGVATGTSRELAAGISGCMGRARAQRMLGGHLLRFGHGERHSGIAELTQPVMTAAQDLALDGQGGVLAVVAVTLGRQLAVVA